MSGARPYVPPRRRSRRTRAILIASLLLTLIAGALMWLVVDYASEQPDQVQLPGGDTFVVGDAERFAQRIDEQGAPILFKDPLSSRPGREIYVLHAGNDADDGWSAVLAYAPGAARRVECVLRWEDDRDVFVDPCGGRTFGADDDRLVRYAAEVNDDGDVEVDLRR